MFQFSPSITRAVGCILVLLLLPSFSFGQVAHGVFRVVKGQVEVKNSKTGEVSRARVGAKVFPLDTIMTQKDSRAKIVMTDNNEINVSPESQITLSKYEYNPQQNKKDVLIDVIYGKVRSKVEQKYEGANRFQVKTPSAVAGVRGTDFLASYSSSDNSSKVVTFKGVVEVGQAGPGGGILNSVRVSAGNFTTKLPGAAPSPPAQMPKNELSQLDKTSDAEKAPSVQEQKSSEEGGPANKGESQEKSEGNESAKAEGSGEKTGDTSAKSNEESGSNTSASNGESGEAGGSSTSKSGEAGGSSTSKSGEAGGSQASASSSGEPGGVSGGDSGGRAPAAQTPVAAGSGGGSASPGSVSPGGASAGGAAVGGTSVGGGSMLQAGDLKAPTNVPAAPAIPTINVNPGLTFVPVPRNDFINNVIQNQNAKVNIKIIQGN